MQCLQKTRSRATAPETSPPGYRSWAGFRSSGPQPGLLLTLQKKKLVPIVILAALWGRQWTGSHVSFHSDKISVVAVLSKHTTAKEACLLHLLCCLYFYAAFYSFHYSVEHVPGILNVAADTLYRRIIHDFLVSSTSPSISCCPSSSSS